MSLVTRVTVLLSVLMAASSADASQTIVGTWRPVDGSCSPADGSMVVGPKSLTFDAYRCDFDDVKRVGDVVTWHGRCGGPEGPSVRSIVVARLKGERLSVTENGRPHEAAYVRCTGPDVSLHGPAGHDRSSVGRSKPAPSTFEGRFTSDCHTDVVCTVDIRRRDALRFDFGWSATGKVGRATLCAHRATMTVGTGRHEAEPVEDVLQGSLVGTKEPAFAAPLRDGRIWLYLNGVACRDLAATARPSMNGIYVRD